MPDPVATRPLTLTATLAALAVALLWGFNFIVMKHAVSEFPPLLLTAMRFALAALPMIFFVARPGCGWWPLIQFGLLFGVVKFSLLFTAFSFGLPSGLGAVVLQTQAFFTIALAALTMRESPSSPQQASLVIALAGVGVIAYGVSGSVAALPVALTLAAAAAWGCANIVLKRLGDVDMLSFMVWASVIPPLPMFALSLVVEGPGAIASAVADASVLGWGAVLYLAYPVSIVSLAMWGNLIARYSAATVAPFALLVPVVGYVCSALIYGERLTAATAIGAVLLVASLVLNSIGPLRASRTSSPQL